jgi:hypothetical protein
MDVAVAARRWADVLRHAWTAGDIDAFVSLYAEDASFRGPFGEPERAADHMRRSLSLGELTLLCISGLARCLLPFGAGRFDGGGATIRAGNP